MYVLLFNDPYDEIDYLFKNIDLNKQITVAVPDESYEQLVSSYAVKNLIRIKKENDNDLINSTAYTFYIDLINCIFEGSVEEKENFYFKFSNFFDAKPEDVHNAIEAKSFEDIHKLLRPLEDIQNVHHIPQSAPEINLIKYVGQDLSNSDNLFIVGINEKYPKLDTSNYKYISSSKTNLNLKKVSLPYWAHPSEMNSKIEKPKVADASLKNIQVNPEQIKKISSTSVEVLAKCPYKFLNSYLLKAGSKRYKLNDDLIPPNDLGNIVHNILDRYIKQSSTYDQLERMIDSEVNKYFKQNSTLNEFKISLNVNKIKLLINKAIEYHRSIEVDKTITEYKLNDFFVHLGEQKIQITGNVDRIDYLGDGISIVDYKTGKQTEKTSKDFFHLGRRLQLGIYALALNHINKVKDIKYLYLTEEKFTVDEFKPNENFFSNCTESLTNILSPIKVGLLPPRTNHTSSTSQGAKKENCDFCDYKLICNVDTKKSWDKVKLNGDVNKYIEETKAV
ncbi:MAG: PD-(D/E)XK nuclease family protein [Acidimicrobiia bacterium]